MRDQTCPVLLANGNTGSQPGPAGLLVKGWTPLRWGLLLAIALLGLFYSTVGFFGGHTLADDDSQDSPAVLVARRYIPAFSSITPSDVVLRNFPKGFVPPGALHGLSELVAENALPVFASAVAIPEGQPVTRTLVNELGKSHGMASILSPGKVAVSFSVDAVRGVGGWVQPGDKVALFATRRSGDARMTWKRQTYLLFSAVQVLSVDRRRVGGKPENPQNAEGTLDTESNGSILTVLMNPVEAARLVEARENGRLSLLLRALGDDSQWPTVLGDVHE